MESIKEGVDAASKDTRFIKIEHVKEALCVTDSWKELWPNVERLLRTPEFKSLIVKELKAVAPQIQKEHILDWTTKLELGVIALLYCQGSLEDKARFFYDLANPNDIMGKEKSKESPGLMTN